MDKIVESQIITTNQTGDNTFGAYSTFSLHHWYSSPQYSTVYQKSVPLVDMYSERKKVGKYKICDESFDVNIEYENITVDISVDEYECADRIHHKPFTLIRQITCKTLDRIVGIEEVRLICNELEDNCGRMMFSVKNSAVKRDFGIEFNVKFPTQLSYCQFDVLYAEPLLIGGCVFMEIHCVITPKNV